MMRLDLLNPYYREKKISTFSLIPDTYNVEWEKAITDRTEEDVKRVLEMLKKGWNNFDTKEKEEWMSGCKGAVNDTDLERIRNNIQLMSDVLGLDLETVQTPAIVTDKYFLLLIENVKSIRSAYSIHSTTPEVPKEPLNTFEKWNDIEKILQDVYEIILNNFSYYCGNEIYAGDQCGLLL